MIIGKENIDKLKELKVISIGPVTTQTAKSLNINVYNEAEVSTISESFNISFNSSNRYSATNFSGMISAFIPLIWEKCNSNKIENSKQFFSIKFVIIS